ncbi:MAG: heavy metal-binding domain-containing protein [Paludibacter sp.]
MKTLKDFFTGSGRKERLAIVEQQGTQDMVHSGSSINLAKSHSHYRCPMGCEGDKTYDSPGNCPVCNMKLVPVSDSGLASQEHKHEGHGHGHHGCC